MLLVGEQSSGMTLRYETLRYETLRYATLTLRKLLTGTITKTKTKK